MRLHRILSAVIILVFVTTSEAAKPLDTSDPAVPVGLVWYGTESELSFERIAAYCAPFLWFSGDEPILKPDSNGYFQLPEPLPFEEPTDKAVVYFRVTRVVGEEDTELKEFWQQSGSSKADWILDLTKVKHVTLHFFFYYSQETGVGAHSHDFETLEVSLAVLNQNDGELNLYGLQMKKMIGHAHGVPWYFNTLAIREQERDIVFPLTVLVEEGKHGNCTDRNGDGFYSPGYDVNKRVNDAWGVKDVLRSGVVLTPSYQTWMTKVRWRESRIAPPLPEDSPWYDHFESNRHFKDDNKRQYILRPTPNVSKVDFSQIDHGANLKHFIESKGYPNWPEAEHVNPLEILNKEMFDESFLGSYGYGYRYDGLSSVTITFPLLLTRNFEAPYVGGWFIQRVYFNFGLFQDDFKLWGQQFTYTPSASRWMDVYFGAGYEIRDFGGPNKTFFVYEGGTKFRAFVGQSSFKFLRKLGSDFWGARVGLKSTGFPEIDSFSFVVEVGAGVW